MSTLSVLQERCLELHPAIPILQKHLEFLVERYEHFSDAGGRPEALEELFSPNWMHEAMSKVIAKGSGNWTKVSNVSIQTLLNRN